MATTLAKAGLDKSTIEEMSRVKNEPEWLLARRLDALHVYNETPMPAENDELWRRTNLKDLDFNALVPFLAGEPSGDPLSNLPADLRVTAQASSAGALVQYNSSGVFAQLASDLKKRGVIFCDLDTALREHPDLVKEYLMTRAVTYSENRYASAKPSTAQSGKHEGGGYGDTVGDLKFAALHAAFFSGGTFLYVPRNVAIEIPLQTLTYFDQPRLAAFTHTLVVLEAGADVKLIEDYASAADEARRYSFSAVELILKENSSLQYFNLQDYAHNVWNFSTQTAWMEANSNLTWLAGTLGSGTTKAFLDCKLVGQGATAAMLGFYFGDEQQRFDQHTFQNHLAPHTGSDLLYKGALKDTAYSVFRGLIRVNPGAQKTDAYQQNRNLLLSDHSHADSIPELEIQANDVRCTHGATVGPIDDEQRFYLMARGIQKSEADRLIVEGFFDPLMQKIPLETIRDRLMSVISDKIGG
jgi:Fe-S cluster assembly protein SufD